MYRTQNRLGVLRISNSYMFWITSDHLIKSIWEPEVTKVGEAECSSQLWLLSCYQSWTGGNVIDMSLLVELLLVKV